MLDVLRGDDVDIQLHLTDNPSSEPGAFQLKGRGQRLVYSATANEFIDICATVENHSSESSRLRSALIFANPRFSLASTLHLSLRLELRPPESSRATPASLSHLARYVVIEGVSPVSVPVLEPGESQTVRVSICLLAEGQYELGCVVEERRGAIEGLVGRERERRSYGAREPLVIDVDR
jgi:trafficking protein particle complex subunit 9